MRPYVKQTKGQTNQDIHIRKLGQLLLDSLKSDTLGFRKQILRDTLGKWNYNKCDVCSRTDIWVLKHAKVTWAHEAQRDRNSWLVLMCHRNVLQGLTCLHRGWGQTSEPYVDTLPRASLGDTEMTGNGVRNFLVRLPFLKHTYKELIKKICITVSDIQKYPRYGSNTQIQTWILENRVDMGCLMTRLEGDS